MPISTYEQAVALYKELEARQRELAESNEALNALYGLAVGFNHCRTQAEVAAFAVQGAMRVPGVRGAWLYLSTGEGYQLAGRAGEVDLDEKAIDSSCTCQRMLNADNLTGAEKIGKCEHLIQADGARGHITIPLLINGRAAGILNLLSDRAGDVLFADQRRMFSSIGVQVSDALDRARLQDNLEYKVEKRTARLLTEIATRREAEHAAEAAKERLTDAIECIKDGFALYDKDDVLLGCNSAYREMHKCITDLIKPGVAFETLVRAGLGCGAGPLRKPTEAQANLLLKRHKEADGTPIIKGRDGRWMMSTEQRTHDGGVVVIETDITELKKADIVKDEFLAKVSHELRTPLTPISGALTMIGSGKIAPLPEKLQVLVEMASRNCLRLMSIVNDLLDFTRISAGRFSLDAVVVELEPLLEQVVQNKRLAPGAPEITLTVDASVKHEKFEVDPFRIQQVLDNLLSNAVKFTEIGGHIEVEVRRRNDAIRVSVVDHGPGIPEKFQHLMFEAFTQLDSSSSRPQGGVGLGLSIAKSIVEAHGGQIGFTSEEAKGTTFYFELPFTKDGESKAKSARSHRAA